MINGKPFEVKMASEYVFCFECTECEHCSDANRMDGCDYGLKMEDDDCEIEDKSCEKLTR